MIEEGNEHMKGLLVIVGAVLFLGGFFFLFTVFSVDNTLKVLAVLIVVGSVIGFTFRKS